MFNSENREPNKELDQLQRIRMLETRMRNKSKPAMNEESVRSIKSTDSKKINPYKSKLVIFEERSHDSREDESQERVKLDQEVKNNRKITDYFFSKSSAKKQQTGNQPRQQFKSKIANPDPNPQLLSSNPPKSNLSIEQALKQQNKTLKQKLRIKQESFNTFRNKMRKELLEQVIAVHKLRRNQMRARVSGNIVRLGECVQQKKDSGLWIDGSEIRDIKEKLDKINKQKQQLQKTKKTQQKKSSKEAEDPEQAKISLQTQLHFLSREELHLQQTLKRLEQEKLLHNKELRLLHDEERSKYGAVDPALGMTVWPRIAQYQLLGLLGKGGFSEVYKAYDVEELREVAVKMHELSPQWKEDVKQNYIKHAFREEAVHKMLNHPNIVKLYGTVEIDQNAFCTILEYCQGPDLSYYLRKHKRLPEKQAKMIIKQVINAIKYLHELPEKIIHYDLKPQNILFHKGKVKITDFGLCKKATQDIIELTSQGVGTYWYLPPECFVVDQKAHISPKVDIWSIGVIYFQLLYGEKPFGNQMSQLRMLNQGTMLKANTVNFPIQPKCAVSNESKQFIKACLKANHEQRLDIKAVAAHSLFEKR